jgi:hypothetical protein
MEVPGKPALQEGRYRKVRYSFQAKKKNILLAGHQQANQVYNTSFEH